MDLFNRFTNIAGSYLIIFRFEEFLRDFKEDFISMGMSLLSRWFEFLVRFESVVIRVILLVSKLFRSVFDLGMSIESCVKTNIQLKRPHFVRKQLPIQYFFTRYIQLYKKSKINNSNNLAHCYRHFKNPISNSLSKT